MNTYGTTITSTLVGKRETPDGWYHYLWTVTLTRSVNGTKTRDLPYCTGMGHEQTKCGRAKTFRLSRYNPPIPCDHMRCNNAGWVPTAPTLLDVLTNLKADATWGEPFRTWCLEYGYDADSITAQTIYFKCQDSERESERFFDEDWQSILEDDDYL